MRFGFVTSASFSTVLRSLSPHPSHLCVFHACGGFVGRGRGRGRGVGVASAVTQPLCFVLGEKKGLLLAPALRPRGEHSWPRSSRLVSQVEAWNYRRPRTGVGRGGREKREGCRPSCSPCGRLRRTAPDRGKYAFFGFDRNGGVFEPRNRRCSEKQYFYYYNTFVLERPHPPRAREMGHLIPPAQPGARYIRNRSYGHGKQNEGQGDWKREKNSPEPPGPFSLPLPCFFLPLFGGNRAR